MGVPGQVNNQILSTHTGQPLEKVVHDTDRDYFMGPDDAKAYGIIDAVYTLTGDSLIAQAHDAGLVGGQVPESAQSDAAETGTSAWRRRTSKHRGSRVPVTTSGSKGTKVPYRCSFCGKGQEQVRKLIAGPGVYICDECVDLCREIIEEEISRRPSRGPAQKLPNPRQIRVRSTST